MSKQETNRPSAKRTPRIVLPAGKRYGTNAAAATDTRSGYRNIDPTNNRKTGA